MSENFDEIIHAPNRLKICAFLNPLERTDFKTLRDELKVSDSVLSKHIKQLEISGYIDQIKGSSNGRKRTWVHLTTKGRKAFKLHIQELRRLVSTSEGISRLNNGPEHAVRRSSPEGAIVSGLVICTYPRTSWSWLVSV